MLKKITELKDVGKFLSHEGSTQSLKKFTGIYAENGKGKTTLATVLRSLAENNPSLIMGRRRLGSPRKPLIRLETDKGFSKFENELWDTSYPNIEIFDTHFVNLNVFSGLTVDITQRRRMYQFIIGDEAIKLNQEVVRLNTEISGYTSKIREQKSELNKYTGEAFKIDDFLKLKKIDNIEEKIKAKTKEINALNNSDKVDRLPTLKKVDLPDFDAVATTNLLNKSLEDISDDAEQKTKKHIEQHMDQHGEGWIKSGLGYLSDSSECPFCKTSIENNDLIASYKKYFNEAYLAFKKEIADQKRNLIDAFPASLSITMKNVIESNERTIRDWMPYCRISLDKDLTEDDGKIKILPATAPSDTLSPFIESLKKVFDQKELTPLETPSEILSFDNCNKNFQTLVSSVSEYNANVDAQNTLLSTYKAGLASGDLKTEQNSLDTLKGSLIRHSDDVNPRCGVYIDLVTKKSQLENEKVQAQETLDNSTKKIPEQYQDKINYFLDRFGAEFYFVDHKKINPRGEPAIEYKLHINGCEIPLGDSNTPNDVASFKNTVSEGDKSTLAFSYFLAKLEADQNISDKIIVFDDPISSQDNSRRERTKSFLSLFGKKAKQIILLSHDPKFLQEMYLWHKNDFSCFEIKPSSKGSKIEISNFENLNKTEHIWNLEKVTNYAKHQDGEEKDVVRSLRPLCEDYCRNMCPKTFGPKETLGGMVTTIEKSLSGEESYILKGHHTDLVAINQYTRPHGHGNQDPPEISPTELLTNCNLVLKTFYPNIT